MLIKDQNLRHIHLQHFNKYTGAHMQKKKVVYIFSKRRTDGSGDMAQILGGKGAALAEMCKIGIPVPPGFTISTTSYNPLDPSKEAINASISDMESDVLDAIRFLGTLTNKEFGSPYNPLLLSVRSGAKISMPGMMDTILNLGINDENVKWLAQVCKNERFAYDSYRRFIYMYSTVVLGMDSSVLEDVTRYYKQLAGVENDYEIPVRHLKSIVSDYKTAITNSTGMVVPQESYTQLWGAIRAVFQSWHSTRAIKYRELYNISHSLGTAVNVQVMVFGNLDNNSATGVVFSRNPTDGRNEIFGEFLLNAQGEDIVAGMRTPQPINVTTKRYQHHEMGSMEEIMPKLYTELELICKKLEKHYRNIQDIEFTVESGKLWILQTRGGKCNIEARLRITSEMVKDGTMSDSDAVCSIDAKTMDKLLHPVIHPDVKRIPILKGLAASPGATSGRIFFTPQRAEKESLTSSVILVRNETSPEDIGGMSVASGILTARGGMTSHAAVVARGMGKPCVCGARDMIIDEKQMTLRVNNFTLHEGDFITIDGSTGEIFHGVVPTTSPNLPSTFIDIMTLADRLRTLRVRANAETENDIKMALQLGAEGIGLCRTEHMFFASDRIQHIRKMIIADQAEEMDRILQSLILYQQSDFERILKIMNGLPTAIRLLDPPLHEFLPKSNTEVDDFCAQTHSNRDLVTRKISQLHEYNPMLGHRGCRLAITHPEIYAMQARAIFHAMVVCRKQGIKTQVEIMIPFVFDHKELDICFQIIRAEAQKVQQLYGVQHKDLQYKLGTMIELPRAALQTSQIATIADFLSFGTNDLTQTTMGISRDDAGSFMQHYLQQGILEYDPFVSLDQSGVGELIALAVKRARAVKPSIKLGICGEHGGDAKSIQFFHGLGLDYVSCSPFRIPAAKLSAAQAVHMP